MLSESEEDEEDEDDEETRRELEELGDRIIIFLARCTLGCC